MTATTAGIHDFDGRLGVYTPQRFAGRTARDRADLAKLTTMDDRALSPHLDWVLLVNAIRDDLLINDTMKRWRHNADDYVNIATGGVFSILSRAFATDDIRLKKIVAREKQIPAMFAQAKVNLTSVDRYSAEIAYDDVMGAISFFKTTVPKRSRRPAMKRCGPSSSPRRKLRSMHHAILRVGSSTVS